MFLEHHMPIPAGVQYNTVQFEDKDRFHLIKNLMLTLKDTSLSWQSTPEGLGAGSERDYRCLQWVSTLPTD